MKMIKQIFLVTALLFSAVHLQAQDVTNKSAVNPTPREILPPAKAPEMFNAPKPLANAEAVTETPLPLTWEKDQLQQEKDKPTLKLADDKEVVSPGGEEARKIMAGKTTKPAPEIITHSTIDPKAVPQPVKHAKPVNGRQQQ